MTKSAIIRALNETQQFAERQKLLKELWKIEREVELKDSRRKQRVPIGPSAVVSQ
jgi:hypothetical protein